MSTMYRPQIDTSGRRLNNMKMYIDGLKIEGSEIAFEVLRINYEMCSRAFHELAKVYNSPECLIDMEIEFHNKAQAIAEYFGGVENDK